jgi:hypothetical protein
MSEFKGTPGSWNLQTETGYIEDDDAQYQVVGEGENPIAWVFWRKGEYYVTGQANARLIAAAPDLLEALQDLMDREGLMCSCTNCDRARDPARAAIAKALGE